MGLLGCVCAPDTTCVGASGAIMGFLGAKFTHLYLTWDTPGISEKIAFKRKVDACFTVFWVLLIFSLGLDNPLIDNWAHLGGLLTGALAGGFLFSDEAVSAQENTAGATQPSQLQKMRG